MNNVIPAEAETQKNYLYVHQHTTHSKLEMINKRDARFRRNDKATYFPYSVLMRQPRSHLTLLCILFGGPDLLKPLAVLLAFNYLDLYRHLVVLQTFTTVFFYSRDKLPGILIA
jgi:hypothetical protein